MAQMVQALRGETRLDARAVPQVVQPALLGYRDGMVSTLAPLFAAAKLGRSFLSALTGQAFLGNGHSPLPPASGRRRLLLVLGFVLPAILTPLTSVFPATLTTLDVEAYGAPPGFLNATCRAIWRSKWQRPRSLTGVSSRLQVAATPQ
jgi:hypothetical protein